MPLPMTSRHTCGVSVMPSKTKALQLHVDWTRCDGHGTCADLLPELIGRDDWGYPAVKQDAEIAPHQRDRAALAVEVCPMLALRLSGS